MLSCEHDYWMICGSNRLTCLILSAGNLRLFLRSWRELQLIILWWRGGGSQDPLTSLLSRVCGQVEGWGLNMCKMRCEVCACVWAVSEGCSKKPTLNLYLVFMCRDASVYDCGCCAFLFPCSHSKILLEDMITRCHTRVLPINKTSQECLEGQSVNSDKLGKNQHWTSLEGR